MVFGVFFDTDATAHEIDGKDYTTEDKLIAILSDMADGGATT